MKIGPLVFTFWPKSAKPYFVSFGTVHVSIIVLIRYRWFLSLLKVLFALKCICPF